MCVRFVIVFLSSYSSLNLFSSLRTTTGISTNLMYLIVFLLVSVYVYIEDIVQGDTYMTSVCNLFWVPDISFLASPNVVVMFCPTPATVEKMMISLSIPTIFIGGSSIYTVDSNR